MRSTTPMRVAKIGYIVISATLCALGGLLMLRTDFSMELLGRLLGILVIVFGAVKLVGYFSKDLYRLAFQHDMASGALLIVLGLLLLFRPSIAASFFSLVFGVVILSDGLLKIQIALDARQFGIKTWWLVITLAAISAVAGCLMIFRPMDGARALTFLFGTALLFEGILNLSVALFTVKIIRSQLTLDADEWT